MAALGKPIEELDIPEPADLPDTVPEEPDRAEVR